jgi:hypothetical protein
MVGRLLVNGKVLVIELIYEGCIVGIILVALIVG